MDPVPTAAPVPPVLAPNAPTDSIITNEIGNFMAQNPLNMNPTPVPAPAPAPSPAPVPAPAPAPAPAPPPPKPFSPSDMLKAASPEPVEPVAEPGAPALEPEDPDAPEETRNDPRARNAWTRTKAELKAAKLELAELRTKISSTPSVDPALTTELETLRRQNQDYENEIGQIKITRSKGFQQRYDAKIQGLRAKAVRTLAALSDRTPEDAADMMQAVEQAPSMAAAREMLSGEPNGVQGAALLALTEIKEELATREAAIQDWRNTRPVIETEADRESQGERLRQIVDQTSTVLKALAAPAEQQGHNSWIFMDQPDNVEWTARRQGLVSAARAVLRDGKPEELARFVLEGQAAQAYREFGEKQYQRAEELQAQLARRNKAIPRVGGGEVGGREAPPRPVVKPLDIEAGVGNLVDSWKKELPG